MNDLEREFDVKAKSDERELEATLGHFRAAVKGWSEHEYSRPRGVLSRSVIPWWAALTRPVTAGALAAGIAAATIALPVYEYETKVREQREALGRQVQGLEQPGKLEARLNAPQNPVASLPHVSLTGRETTMAVDDDELLSHVDSDISQSAPDAFEPLASLMSETR